MTIPLAARVQVRAWTTPDYEMEPWSGRRGPGPSPWALIFDTETTTTLGQGLRLVTYQVRHRGRLREQGIAYTSRLNHAERDVVAAYARPHGLKVLTREQFIDLFFQIGYDRQGLIIGFNLPFDLSRLAIRHAVSKPRRAQRRMRGGFAFTLSRWGTRSTVRIRRVSARAAFIQFTGPEGRLPEHRNQARGGTAATFRGHFVDVATIASALFGHTSSLARLADTLGLADGKLDIAREVLGGPVTEELLDYAMRDTQVTWDAYQALAAQYQTLGMTRTPVHALYSPASVAKAHLAQIGVRGWAEVQPDVPRWLIATVMETYYGGRTETKIRRVLTPGVLTDVTSEYPTVFTLQRLGRWLIGDGVDWHDENAADTTAWVRGLTVDTLLDPVTWPQLTRLVHVQPGPHDLLPTRADYTGAGSLNVAIAHRTAGGPAQWYALADVADSYLATGRVPKILRTLAFTPRPPQDGLRAITMAGSRHLDPYADDLISALVELRADLKASKDPVLNAAAPAIKAAASSACYGAPIEMNTIPWAKPVTVTVHRSDGTNYPATTSRTEEPGRFFHPLIATWTSAAGRLLLALIMRMVDDAGGTYAFCDTDSLFIAATRDGGLHPCPGGAHRTVDGQQAVRALSWAQVDQIVDRLRPLNPLCGRLAGQSVLKVEPDNYDPATGEQRQVLAWCVASKRYTLLTRGSDGQLVIISDHGQRRRSEHGLGHLLAPTNPTTPAVAGADPADFHDQWWALIIDDELNLPHEKPDWLDRPALGRLTVTSPRDEAAFRQHNRGRRYDQQVRPWNFGLVAYPTPGERARTGVRVLIAPLARDPRTWTTLTWRDRDHPNRTYRIRTGDDTYLVDGAITVQTYRDYLVEYRQHPEAKAAGPDGDPCRPDTVGLLQPHTIDPGTALGRIGKETNRVTDDNDLADGDDLPVTYAERMCRGCASPVTGRRHWCSEACRKRTTRLSPTEQ